MVYYIISQEFWIGDDGAKKTNKRVINKLKRTETPFFLFINYMETHALYRPPRKYAHKFTDEKISRMNKLLRKYRPPLKHILGEGLTEREKEILRALYDSEIFYLDSIIGHLYNSLEKIGKLNNTVFIVTSDHGDFLGEHGLTPIQGDYTKKSFMSL